MSRSVLLPGVSSMEESVSAYRCDRGWHRHRRQPRAVEECIVGDLRDAGGNGHRLDCGGVFQQRRAHLVDRITVSVLLHSGWNHHV